MSENTKAATAATMNTKVMDASLALLELVSAVGKAQGWTSESFDLVTKAVRVTNASVEAMGAHIDHLKAENAELRDRLEELHVRVPTREVA